MTVQRPVRDHLTRRTALTGAATVGLGIPLLAACGSDADTAGSATDPATGSASSSAPTASGAASSAPADGAAAGLSSTADIEVGGGTVFKDEKVVVTQPAAGEFKCFTAVCTHTGCLVGEVTSDGIECPCHGSVFSSEDGSVLSGPAPTALDAVDFTVTGDQISLT